MSHKLEKLSFEEVKGKVIESLQELLKHDHHLLTHDLHERTIAHKLAVYLQNKFKGHHVDCEYNGNVDVEKKRKAIDIFKYECIEFEKGLSEKDRELMDLQGYLTRSVYPDIIVHERGNNQRNLLAIEIKKATNLQSRHYDTLKLEKYVAHYDGLNYKYGLLINLKRDMENRDLVWFHNTRTGKI